MSEITQNKIKLMRKMIHRLDKIQKLLIDLKQNIKEDRFKQKTYPPTENIPAQISV